MHWHPKSNLPDLKTWKSINESKNVYQSTQDEICFLIINEDGDWIIAYERYGGNQRLVKNLPWCGPHQ